MNTIFNSLGKGMIILFFCISFATYGQPYSHTPRFDFVDNNINGFWEYLPRNYKADNATRYPLLVFVHGAGQQGDDKDIETLRKVLEHGVPKIINQGSFPDSFRLGSSWVKFIVVSPQIKNGMSENERSTIIKPSTIQSMIDYAKQHYRIDTTRIYLSGFSMGGGATWKYAGSSLTAAKKLAGIIVAAGAYDLDASEAKNIAQAKLPVLATHNKDDDVIFAQRTMNNIFRINSSVPPISPLPRAVYWPSGGHNVWTRTFEDLIPGNANLVDTLGMSAFDWALKFSRTAGSVPVTWKSFEAAFTATGILLKWTITNQVNVQGYTVERSTNGIDFSGIALIAPLTIAADQLYYRYQDLSFPSGQLYYRIKQTDVDGKFSYSKVRKVSVDSPTDGLKVFPNPFQDQLSLDLTGMMAQPLSIRLLDTEGKLVKQMTIRLNINNRSQVAVTGLQQLARGTYYLFLVSPEGKTIDSKTLIKK